MGGELCSPYLDLCETWVKSEHCWIDVDRGLASTFVAHCPSWVYQAPVSWDGNNWGWMIIFINSCSSLFTRQGWIIIAYCPCWVDQAGNQLILIPSLALAISLIGVGWSFSLLQGYLVLRFHHMSTSGPSCPRHWWIRWIKDEQSTTYDS